MKTINTSFLFMLLLITVMIGSSGCHFDRHPNEAPAKETIPETHSGLTQKQMQTVGIQMGTIVQKNMHAVVRANGQLAVPPQNRADVNVLYGGIIRTILVQEGEVVRKGQTLALLEHPDFIKLQEQYLSAKRNFVFTQEELQRQQDLSDAKAGTGKNLQKAKADFQAQKAELLSLKQQLEQLGLNPMSVEAGNIVRTVAVRAPISGTVGHIVVNTGAYVTTANPLMEIIDNSKIHADLIVFEKDLFKVKPGQKVRFTLTNQDNKELVGEIYGINKSFEDETKGIVVHVAIQHSDTWHLIPGMYVTGLIDVGNQEVSVISNDGLVHANDKDYIYLVERVENGFTHFKKVEVVSGVSELGFTQITPVTDLPNDAQVVTKGAFYLLSSESEAGDEH